jgi:hypothetical protein
LKIISKILGLGAGLKSGVFGVKSIRDMDLDACFVIFGSYNGEHREANLLSDLRLGWTQADGIRRFGTWAQIRLV